METALFLDPSMLNLVSAVAVGALIGAERERRKGEGPARSPAGIRTFTITSISGAVAFALGGVGLLAVVTGSVAVMVAVSYWRAQDQDPGLTTEIVLVLTALLGGMCMQAPQTAAAIAVAVTVLLYAKAWLHNLVTSVISKDELEDALIFAAATLVVLPLVPNRQMGPYLALNPHSIWIVIVLVMAISAAGYIAVRLFGARFGLPLAGAISGFISSTATIGAMGSRAKKSNDLLAACVAGAVLSTVATVAQMALVVAATSMPTLFSLSGPLLLAGGAAMAYGTAFTLLAARNSGGDAVQTGGVFSLKTALAFGSILAPILVISAGLQERFGGAGVLLAAVVAGLVDTHAVAISVATLVASGKVTPQDAVLPILAGLTSNTLTKIIMAATSGGWAFALRVLPGLILVALAAWIGTFAALLWN
ncbi:MAG: MgtC/SapB family protein [Pseudorhodobacter sp.]|nr:MgtC/SapB family protein [Pseudorhodobacter sp.]